MPKTKSPNKSPKDDPKKDAKDCYKQLRLKNQLCFPLYAASKEIVKRYRPFLSELDLTYTQYITMMVLWERKQINVKELGECLYLDSGTMTPLLKKLESKGYIQKQRMEADNRNVLLTLTAEGEVLQQQAAGIPARLGACVQLSPKEADTLYTLLYKVLAGAEQA